MNYTILDDTQLLQLLQESNEEAFAEVYNRFWKLLHTTAFAIIQQEEATKDAVQDVFIALWQRRNEAQIQSLKAYLQQAVRFRVLKAIREQKTDEQFYARLAAATAYIIYENPLLFKEQQALLNEILDALPTDCRQIFAMSREEQLTYKQIAAQLEISEKTVEKKMSICLKHIRTSLERNQVLAMVVLVCITGQH